MLIPDDKLKLLLIENGITSAERMEEFVAQAAQQKQSLYETLIDRDVISENNLVVLVADDLNMPFVSLSKVTILPEVLRILPESFAKQHSLVVYQQEPDKIKVALADVTHQAVLPYLAKKARLPVVAALTTQRDIDQALRLYKRELNVAFEDLFQSDSATGKTKPQLSLETPTSEIVDTLLEYGYHSRASDIHIEPEEKTSLVRFRIDGLLHDVLRMPMAVHDQVVTRIKVMASLRTDEHLSAQDGKLQTMIKEANENVDVRVSIAPIVEGEKVVLRLLTSHAQRFSLSDIGMSDTDLSKVRAAIEKPYGMILATGPTGSGKTTTIYSLLKIINTRDKNIASIEDPVEYEIEGINQIQVNPKANLTFATGLRALLRQDPDVIFVGEIRDQETADIATNSAMTGHLVVSTLHTNDAVTALPRLLDMGIEPFLVASTVNVIIAQRLVRQICQTCRFSHTVEIKELEKTIDRQILERFWGKEQHIIMYQGKGCDVCKNTGYVGRLGIFEVLQMTEGIKALITEKADAQALFAKARAEGMTTMFENGLSNVQRGVTTLGEVLRVTKMNEHVTS